jgi:hypothetical protein
MAGASVELSRLYGMELEKNDEPQIDADGHGSEMRKSVR